ncbi:MAG: transcriptional repressor [Planctomycetota bacterium]
MQVPEKNETAPGDFGRAQKFEAHPTALELFKVVRKRLPKVSLGTVYRNLELLVRMGRIRKLVSNGSETRFDGMPDQHYHIRCSECNRIDNLSCLPMEVGSHELEPLDGYKITGIHFEFTGICPDCSKQQTRV